MILVCYSGCSDCFGSNANQCTSCVSSYYLLAGTCYNPCPVGYFGNASSGKKQLSFLFNICLGSCVACYISCQTCNSTTSSDCLSCYTNNNLINGVCTGSCNSAGTFLDSSNH